MKLSLTEIYNVELFEDYKVAFNDELIYHVYTNNSISTIHGKLYLILNL